MTKKFRIVLDVSEFIVLIHSLAKDQKVYLHTFQQKKKQISKTPAGCFQRDSEIEA